MGGGFATVGVTRMASPPVRQLPTPPNIDAFLDQCRALQNAAARLCQEDSGLSAEGRESVKKLRILLLETRRQVLASPTGRERPVGKDARK
jgi:hypothetical protein